MRSWDRRHWASWLTRAAVAAAFVVSLVQIAWVGRWFMRLAVGKVWENRSLDAMSRSADAAYGYDYMLYIQFLREEIPESSIVALTRTEGLAQYDSRPFLQYFLIPRQVIDCPSGPVEDCVLELSDGDVYFLYGGGIALPDEAAQRLLVVPFDERRGVFAPR